LPAGRHRIEAKRGLEGDTISISKTIDLRPRETRNSVDFVLGLPATVTGLLVDENQEALQDIRVQALRVSYRWREPQYNLEKTVATNDLGEYRISGLVPGARYVLAAYPKYVVPAAPTVSKRVFAPSYYPNSPSLHSAQLLLLSSGEQRSGMNFQLAMKDAHCVSGVLRGLVGDMSLATVYANIGNTTSDNIVVATTRPARGGEFRLCGLYPGQYRFEAISFVPAGGSGTSTPTQYATTWASVKDVDLNDILLPLTPGVRVQGVVEWANEPSEASSSPPSPLGDLGKTASADHPQWMADVELIPKARQHLAGDALTARTAIPGRFLLASVWMGDYEIRVRATGGAYVKELTANGESLRENAIRVGTALGADEIRIVAARKSAAINVQVRGDQGIGVPETSVVAIPAGADQATWRPPAGGFCITNQDGGCTLVNMPTGKYYVIAFAGEFDQSPEMMNGLWKSVGKGSEVEIHERGDKYIMINVSEISR